MCAETIVEVSNGGTRIPSEADLKLYLKRWDKYGLYKVLDILQTFYRTDATREAFVMCSDIDVQRLTFDSYLYKKWASQSHYSAKITAKTP